VPRHEPEDVAQAREERRPLRDLRRQAALVVGAIT
jgi:hypothetical protein